MKKNRNSHPSHTSRGPLRFRILSFFLRRQEHLTLAGDFEELYAELRSKEGRRAAELWYWGQILKSIPSCLNDFFFWRSKMLKNYIKTALRNIIRHKGYSFINITGLAIGMACCLLICLWIQDELSFDRFHAHTQSLFRVEFDQNYSGKDFHVNVTPYPMARALEAEIPEIEYASRYSGMGELLFRSDEKIFYEDNVKAVDPAFLEMFSFPLIRGNKATALTDPNSLILSQTAAQKYFGREDPIGKILKVNNRTDFIITGVMEDVPPNSSLSFDMLVSFKLLEISGGTNDQWDNNEIPTFVKLSSGADPYATGVKIRELVSRHSNVEDLTFSLNSLTRIHLYSHSGFDTGPRASQYVYIFSVIAFFVLLIACINFMNLATARSARRAKEVGIRKVVGAGRSDIVRQFYGESLIFTLISLGIAVALVIIVLPFFNSLTGKSIALNLINYWQLLTGLAAVAVFTGWISGSYPALFLGSFQPIRTLKGKLKSGPKNVFFRRTLVIIQFSLSISLIIGTGVVLSQLDFLKTKKMGYDREHTIYIPMRGVDRGLYPQLKAELERYPGLLGVSGAQHRPSAIRSNTSGSDWEGKDPELDVSTFMTRVDYDYFKTMDIPFVDGRSFSREFTTDEQNAYIVNEEVIQMMDVESPLAIRFGLWGNDGKIIGVVKNFHFSSLKRAIEPLVIMLNTEVINYVLIRLQTENIQPSLAFIEKTWQGIIPDFPFEFRFLNTDFDRLYRGEERMSDILKYFAILAVFIACLGLLGLASFAAEQRTKEIGIRKVLGATSSQVAYLIYKEFVLLLGIAILISWPVSYLVMRGWLHDFAYRAGINVVVFFMAALAAVLSAFLTVGYQALKASRSDPVRALRYE